MQQGERRSERPGEKFRGGMAAAGAAAAVLLLACVCALCMLQGFHPLLLAGLALSALLLLGIVRYFLRRRIQPGRPKEDPAGEQISRLQWNIEFLSRDLREKKTAAENAETEYRGILSGLRRTGPAGDGYRRGGSGAGNAERAFIRHGTEGRVPVSGRECRNFCPP